MTKATTAPARPKNAADIAALMVDGAKDVHGAAAWLGMSPRAVERVLKTRALWSFRAGGKRLIPVVELRRWLTFTATKAMEY